MFGTFGITFGNTKMAIASNEGSLWFQPNGILLVCLPARIDIQSMSILHSEYSPFPGMYFSVSFLCLCHILCFPFCDELPASAMAMLALLQTKGDYHPN